MIASVSVRGLNFEEGRLLFLYRIIEVEVEKSLGRKLELVYNANNN